MAIDPRRYDNMVDLADTQAGLDEWIAGKESSYEDRMVKQVLTNLGLNTQYNLLKKQARELSGEIDTALTFNLFHEAFPTFPVRLCAQNYVKAHEMTIMDMFKKFTKTMMYKKFMESKELIPDGEQYGSWGTIFQWSGLGQMILHNSQLPDINGTRVVRSIGDKQFVYLDILGLFLQSICDKWSP